MAGTVRRGGQIAWAGLKLGVAVLRLRRRAPDRLPAYISTTLVGLGTTFVKLGQGLSLRWDLLPAPYREALSRLHSDVPAFPAEQARRSVEQAFGAPVDALFASFDDRPLAAASVAQIHPARMHDGRDVVVKITRPGIHAQVQADLRLLRRTVRVAQWLWPPLTRHRPLELVDELGAFLRDEIDMRHEAQNMRRMARVLDALPGITQPHVAQSIAAMATGIGGLDHVVFSGGIGHRAPGLRARIIARLGWLGLALTPADNDAGATRIDGGNGPAIWNVAIDEELELAESALAWL